MDIATQARQRLTNIIFLSVLMIMMAGAASAQSTDVDNPVVMTKDSMKGTLPKGKPATHYYSFTGGPGEIKVFYDFTGQANVGGQLLDADGLPIENLYITESGVSHNSTNGMSEDAGIRLVSRHLVKRRQKLIVAIYTTFVPDENIVVNYRIRVAGDDVAFGQGNSSSNISAGGTQNNSGEGSLLPKSGKLRLVMDDGTVQEINLSRVREVSIKP